MTTSVDAARSELRGSRALEIGASACGLAVLAVASFYLYLAEPPVPFRVPTSDGRITFAEAGSAFVEGDVILEIDGRPFDELRRERMADPYRTLREGRSIVIVVERQGERLSVPVSPTPRRMTAQILFFALGVVSFWLAGMLAVFWLRPQGEGWRVLVACFLLAPLWIAFGCASGSSPALARLFFHLVHWPFWALVAHLHLALPDPLFGPRHRRVTGALWVAVVALEIVDLSAWLPTSAMLLFMATAVAAAVGLLAWRLRRPAMPRWRVAGRIMAFGVALGLVPMALSLTMLSPLMHRGFTTRIALTFAFSFLPVWPLSYVYAMYRHDLGILTSRANRAAGLWAFLAFYALAYGLTLAALDAASAWVGEVPGATLAFALSLAFVLAASTARRRFQAWIDRVVFGIRHDPQELVTLFARRIPTAGDRQGLRAILRDEILPTFMIRQSALYLIPGGVLYEQNLAPADRLGDADLGQALNESGAFVPIHRALQAPLSWVRLALPLVTPSKEVGVWLFGRRDPDDFYSRDEIDALTALANQIAPVLENFRLLDAARKELEERRELEAELAQAQKLDALGRLSAGIAHDFNNLLSVVLGHCGLLLATGEVQGAMAARLLEIQQAGRRGSDLIRQLLAFSRRGEQVRQWVDIRTVVEDAARMLSPILGDDVEVEVRASGPPQKIWIDPGQLGQALLNLATNARDAMPSGGKIVIETSAVRLDGRDASDGLRVAGDYVRLTVSDDGSGMAPEVKARIFEPFFSTKGPGRGTGLGLSMVHGFVRQSGGRLEVESEVGHGTRFDLFFPVGSA